MKEGTRNVFVGVFVLASLGALATLAVWFGEAPSWLGGAEWELKITGVRELSGISEGTPVHLNGVEIGRVDRLEFEDAARPHAGVVIVAGIKRAYTIPRGTVARVYGATLGFGTGHVALVVEDDREMAPLDTSDARIPGEMRSVIGEWVNRDLFTSLDRAIREFGDLAADLRPVAQHLAGLLEPRRVEDVEQSRDAKEPEARIAANMATVIERFDDVVRNLNAVLGDPDVQGDLRATVSDLREGAEELRRMLALWQEETKKLSQNVNEGVDEARESLRQSFVRLHQTLDHLEDASRSLARVLNGIEQGEGTAGRLARDPRLYEAAVISFERLGDLLASLRRISGKIEEDGYITVGQATPVGTFTKRFSTRGRETMGTD